MTPSGRQHPTGTPYRARTLRPRQVAFVRAFVRNAGRCASEAAREAGFSAKGIRVHAHRLLRQDYILAAIKAQPNGAAVLEHLAESSQSPRIRMLADFVLADRSGFRVSLHDDGIRVLVDQAAAASREYAIDFERGAEGQEKRQIEEVGLIERVDSAAKRDVSHCGNGKTEAIRTGSTVRCSTQERC